MEIPDGITRRSALAYNDPHDSFAEIESFMDEWSKSDPDENELYKFNIRLAAMLLIDGILPTKAGVVLGNKILAAMDEIIEKKQSVKALGIEKKTRGRPPKEQSIHYIYHEVGMRIKDGMSKTSAYKEVADQENKSPETIRRIFEREKKKRIERFPQKSSPGE